MVVHRERESQPPRWLQALRTLRLTSPAPSRTTATKSPSSKSPHSNKGADSGRSKSPHAKSPPARSGAPPAAPKGERRKGMGKDNRASRGARKGGGIGAGSARTSEADLDSEAAEELGAQLRYLELERLKQIEAIEIATSQKKKALREEARRTAGSPPTMVAINP